MDIQKNERADCLAKDASGPGFTNEKIKINKDFKAYVKRSISSATNVSKKENHYSMITIRT